MLNRLILCSYYNLCDENEINPTAISEKNSDIKMDPLKILKTTNNFSINPSPFEDFIEISWDEYEKDIVLNFRVVNISGKVLYDEDVDAKSISKRINLQFLDSGTYIFIISEENNLKSIQKITKL